MKLSILLLFSMLFVNHGHQDASVVEGFWVKINKREPYNGYLFTKGNHYLVEYYECRKSRENSNDLGIIDYEVTLDDYKYTIKDSTIRSTYYNPMVYLFKNDTLIVKRNNLSDTLVKSKDQKTPVFMEKFNVKLYLNS